MALLQLEPINPGAVNPSAREAIGGRRKTFGSVILRLARDRGDSKMAPSEFAKVGRGAEIALILGRASAVLRGL